MKEYVEEKFTKQKESLEKEVAPLRDILQKESEAVGALQKKQNDAKKKVCIKCGFLIIIMRLHATVLFIPVRGIYVATWCNDFKCTLAYFTKHCFTFRIFAIL